MGIAAGLDRYALNELAARAGRMHRGGPITAPAIPSMPYAFHFDASLFAGLLRRFADERHVERTEGRLTEVMRDGSLDARSDEQTSELQSLMRISNGVISLANKTERQSRQHT